LFLFFLFSLLIIQFYKLQVNEGEKWTKLAGQQHELVVTEPFKRGSFYSSNGKPLAVDIPKCHLYIDPDAFPEEVKDVAAEKIAGFFFLKGKEKTRVHEEFHKKSRSRRLILWLDSEMQGKIQKWWADFAKERKLARNGIFFVHDYKRSYPFGSLLGQLLHTVQEDKDVHTFQGFPTGGLELQYNNYLKGKLGKRTFLHSPSHPLDKGKVTEVPQNGSDVYLTINHHLQAIAEEELAKGVANAGAKGGWAVLMDPYTGEILALAQHPPFDPRNYRNYFNDPSLQEETHLKAISHAFEPGSIFKPVSYAIFMIANEELKKSGKKPVFVPGEMIPTASGRFPNTSFTLKDGRTHAYMNMYIALQKSANIYPGKIVQKVIESLGDEWYRNVLVERFGFGKKTGIAFPSETPGMVPTPGKLHPNKKLEWSTPTPYALIMGHNILVNSIQMVKFYAMLANGGFEVQPTLLKKIVSGDNVLVDETPKHVMGKRMLSPEMVQEIVKGMRFVTKLGGTARRGDIKGYTEAGKSGSSEKIIGGKYSKEKFISSFCGFAPAKRPKIVMMVTVDEPEVKFIPEAGKNYLGGVCASPIFREIGARTLSYMGVEPDDPGSLPGSPEKPEWSKEVKELQELYNKWNVNEVKNSL
ncbi:MAG TPA: penicillin-binding protein 2, partial [Chlamydiales bacterium]|nr:penicillin-binding protein 2 [Chlamydiales bacterium]